MRQAEQTSIPTRSGTRLALTLLSVAALMAGCGGGGGPQAPVPDFERLTFQSSASALPVDVVRDNRTSIVWARSLGPIPAGTGYTPRLPSAAELLHLADTTSDADLLTNFPFVFSDPSKKVFEASEKSNVQQGTVWVVDLVQDTLKGAMRASNDFNSTARWFVLEPSSPAIRSANYDINTGTGIAHSTDGRLSWKVCVEGMDWNGTNCVGTPIASSEQQALMRVSDANTMDGGRGYGRINWWRLPTKQELQSLLSLEQQPPSALILQRFNNYDLVGTSWQTPFRTSSASTAGFSWSISFENGEIDPMAGPADLLHVRLVSDQR